jgi:FAD binding domain/Hint module/Berberine and berberine like
MFRALWLAAAALSVSCLSGASAAFPDCFPIKGATLFSSAGKGGAQARALYPLPAPNFYVDITEAAAVGAVVKCAVANKISICPRSGGHSFVGQSSCSGVVIDVWQLKDVKFDASTNTAMVQVGNTLGAMFYEIFSQSSSSRMIGVGLCPSVGTGGYLLGGGHNPYSGKIGLTCESVLEYTIVTLDGKTVKANKKENQELFWASCGGGGGHFGVVTDAKLMTHDASIFNKNVHFRYLWPIGVAGEVLHKWFDYDQDGGDSWVRLEVNSHSPMFAYGVCWNSGSVADCEARLAKNAFFNVPGRQANATFVSSSVLEFQSFIGPNGKWGWTQQKNPPKSAFAGDKWPDSGVGTKRLYSSAYWEIPTKPSIDLLQKMCNICNTVDNTYLDFTLCQWNPWRGEQRVSEGKSDAFAHREFDVFTELIGAYNAKAVTPAEQTAAAAELKRLYDEIIALTGRFIGGVYVSYPEFNLDNKDYPYLYWGQSLPRLAKLKAKLDPTGVLMHFQGLPSGDIACPGRMGVKSAAPKHSISVIGYPMGQTAGMRVVFYLPPSCSIAPSGTSGASITTLIATKDGKEVKVHEARIHTPDPFTIVAKHDEGSGKDSQCIPSVVTINSITCSNITLSDTVAPPTVSNTTSKPKSPNDAKSGCFPASAKVETSSRGFVRMSDLVLGDKVRVSPTAFSPIFFFSHQYAGVSGASFISIATCDDDSSAPAASCPSTCTTTLRRITLTANHYLVLASGRLAAAESLSVGDMLRSGAADSSRTVSVVAVAPAGADLVGLYNPHTLTGQIVVDGVLASCYTRAVHPAIARLLLSPLAILYRMASSVPNLKGLIDISRPHLGQFVAGPYIL